MAARTVALRTHENISALKPSRTMKASLCFQEQVTVLCCSLKMGGGIITVCKKERKCQSLFNPVSRKVFFWSNLRQIRPILNRFRNFLIDKVMLLGKVEVRRPVCNKLRSQRERQS